MDAMEQLGELTGPDHAIWLGAFIGAAVGLFAGLVILLIARKESKRSLAWRSFPRRARTSLVVALVVLGLWVGYTLAQPEIQPDWYEDVHHGLLLIVIATSAWFWYAALGMLGEPSMLVNVSTGRDVRRFRTQAQVLRRSGQAAVVFLAIALGLLTFPETRAPVTSVLASAGVLSVIAGLAAQTSLSNMFAGLQLAFTDAVRVGDTVVVPGEEQPGSIEEITLTYIVVRIWDERRLILPSTEFTTKPFENWTRKHVKQLAVTSIQVDWSAPIAEIRAEVGRLVEDSPLWDGRTWSVQVFEVSASHLELLITVSADNWAAAWDLRAYVRENIVAWLVENAPDGVPRDHLEIEKPLQVKPLGPEELDPAALQGPLYVGPSGGGKFTKRDLMEADPDKAFAKEVKEVHKKLHSQAEDARRREHQKGKYLFFGSMDGKERAKAYKGPGEQALRQRRDRDRRRKQDIDSIPLD